MPELNEIKPIVRPRIYDLIQEAGVDVSDWSNSKGGIAKAASNPKYCYDWSFVEPGKVVVLNLWHSSMEIREGKIVQDINARNVAKSLEGIPNKHQVVKRALAVDNAIQTALQHQLPVRIVVCDGSHRNTSDPAFVISKVEKRLLDPQVWAVTKYNWAIGACTVTRGEQPLQYMDQFENTEPLSAEIEQKTVSGKVYTRNPKIRKRVLARAIGLCEFCGVEGFRTHDGRIYLETHHITPLSEDGEDSELNVAALCPNHHQEAHFGENRSTIAELLKVKISEKYAEQFTSADR